MRRAMSGILTITMLGVSCSVLVAAEWGNLSGQIVYDGTPPTPEKAVITADKEVCCLHDVIVESLLVDPQSKGVKDVIIYLYQDKSGRRRTEEDEKAVPIHESYEALEPARPSGQQQMSFRPTRRADLECADGCHR